MSKSLVDLRADLLDLAREAAILREEIALYQADAGGENVARELLSKSGLAANTAKLYTGCERIMEYIAKVADNAPIGHGDGGWHAALLKRMSQPSLISERKLYLKVCLTNSTDCVASATVSEVAMGECLMVR